MTLHLYLSLIPEALIASMLPPEEFGVYYTVGYSKKQAGQAMFVELDPEFRDEFFNIEEGLARCVPHKDGRPKKSVYIATYRVLEHVPLKAIHTLHLVTRFGEILTLNHSTDYPKDHTTLYMYQEIAPTSPLVVSSLDPLDFSHFLTDDSSGIYLPAVCFVDLRLGALAKDPENGPIGDLPYDYIHHLRECLLELKSKTIHTKMVDRTHTVEYPYRMINSGIYIGNKEGLAYFPLPNREKLRSEYYTWWRSANQ
ncbi:MAG: hypothetical protein CSA11_05880 [Chloroflexi bacterium]|nr:MAG: hypothetical protein CSB13_08800 [Chloroflexota bacterium]PIE80987.1 MAG: hypothetical protein CSA11_05880 [Chloroflexota bacterium]